MTPEPAPDPGKVRIPIRLDEDPIGYFAAIAGRSRGKTRCQTLINSALHEYVARKSPRWKYTLKRISREEIDRNSTA